MTRESYRLVDNFLHSQHSCLPTHPPLTSCQSIFSHPFIPLSVMPHHSEKYHGFFFYFSTFQIVPFYYIIFMHAIHHLYRSSPSYCFLSISVAFKQHIGIHPPLSISLTLAPTLPSAKLSSLGHIFIYTYAFSLSDHLTHYYMIACQPPAFSHTFLSIFIHRITIPFTLTSLNNIRLTNSITALTISDI